jgi:hypothetical protein
METGRKLSVGDMSAWSERGEGMAEKKRRTGLKLYFFLFW